MITYIYTYCTFLYLLAICYFLTTGREFTNEHFLLLLNILIILMIVRIAGWNVTLCLDAIDCASMLIVLLNVSSSLMIVGRCYWFSFGVIDCQLSVFKCPLGVLDCRKMLLFVRWQFINMQIALLNAPWRYWSASWCYRRLIDSTLRENEYLFRLNDQPKV